MEAGVAGHGVAEESAGGQRAAARGGAGAPGAGEGARQTREETVLSEKGGASETGIGGAVRGHGREAGG